MKIYTVYFNEQKHAEEIKLIEKAMKISPDSRSGFGFKAMLKEAKRVIKASEKR